MPRPKIGYIHPETGKPLIGASTIAGYFKGGEAVNRLLGWARREALAKRDHTETLAKAADIGTAVHSMVEQRIRGQKVDCSTLPAEDQEKAWKAFGAYEKWAVNHPMEMIAMEIPLVDRYNEYGGTLDFVGRSGDNYILCDWKTSDGIWETHAIQLGGYWNLWNANRRDQPISSAYCIAFSKDGRLAPSYFGVADLIHLWGTFLDCLRLHRSYQELPYLLERSKTNA